MEGNTKFHSCRSRLNFKAVNEVQGVLVLEHPGLHVCILQKFSRGNSSLYSRASQAEEHPMI